MLFFRKYSFTQERSVISGKENISINCFIVFPCELYSDGKKRKEKTKSGISQIRTLSFVQYKHFSLVADIQLLSSLYTLLQIVFQLRPSIKLCPTEVL